MGAKNKEDSSKNNEGKMDISKLRASALNSVHKTLRNTYYMTTLASILLKLITTRKMKKFSPSNPIKKRDFANSTEKFISEWRDYLLFVHQLMEQLNSVIGKKEDQSELKNIVSITRNLRFALKNNEKILIFFLFFRNSFWDMLSVQLVLLVILASKKCL